jgi:hypothetical protein
MSLTPIATSNYQVIFDNALEAYKKKTKKELRSHPLLPKLQACNSPDAVLTVLREQIPAFDQSHSTSGTNDKLTNWLNPTVNVLFSFSGAIGAGISMVSNKSVRDGGVQGLIFIDVQVYPPAGVIFTGIGVLLSVSIPLDSIASTTLKSRSIRQPTAFLAARMRSRTYLSVSRISFDGLRPMSKFQRRQG